MGFFDGFPFTSKDERERKRKDFEKRVVPFGTEASREKLRAVLKELFPKVDVMDSTFAFYNAKDAYTLRETEEEGRAAARFKLEKTKDIDDRAVSIFIRLIELEMKITSLDEYPTAQDVLNSLANDK